MSLPVEHRRITYAGAIREAVQSEMARDSSVFVMGQGVDDPKGTYGTTLDLHKEFGAERSFDTPIAEESMTGVAVGAALNGMRPVHVHQRVDFLMLCMNQLVNMAAKMSYMFGGGVNVPMVVRAGIGRSWGQGAQHSQSLHGMLMHVPGLKVVVPSSPYDAKGCLIAAIRDNNPVIMIEHRMLYRMEDEVPEASYEVPIGQARVLREGADVTIVAISHMVIEALRAVELLEEKGLSVELIDPISVAPLDMETILTSVAKTKRLLFVDNDWTTAGASAEVLAAVAETYQGHTAVQVKRLGYHPSPCPTTRPLEDAYYPDPTRIAEAALAFFPGRSMDGTSDHGDRPEIREFKGPF
ncbi:MAG: transketolase C-terminal domain-containing protein [Alphaproteobacteria bacterium]|nr:transketolase C-terminal domain-containing protein [Alphaproteobacteria bacterium]